MKKVKISYTPPVMYVMIALICIAIIFGTAAFLNELCLYVSMLVGIVAFLYVHKHGTTVEFGDGKIIRCRCIFYRWKIDLENIDSFSYTVSEHLTRGGIRHSMGITFYHSMKGIKDCYKLTSWIMENEMKKLLRNDADKLEIMQIYKYAESLYPDKAEGYTEKDKINM